MKQAIIVGIVFVGSILFRLWFITLAPQPYINDQMEYDTFATRIFYDPHLLASHSYRTYPYPLLLALIYRATGFGNHPVVFFLQAVLDSMIGVLVFLLLRYGLGRKTEALVGQIMYSVNPFTAGYVGVILSEILSSFFILTTIATGMLLIKTRNVFWALVFGLSTGLAAETRNAALLWALIPMGLMFFWVNIKRNKLVFLGMIVGFLLTLVYPLINNKRDFDEWNVTTVDSFFAKELFNGVELPTLAPFTIYFPNDVSFMFSEYYSEWHPKRTAIDRREMASKYYKKAWERIAKNPVGYIRVRFRKMWYMWQKENIFFYVEPGFESHWRLTYIGNLLLLFSALWGIVMSFTKKWVYMVMIATLLYATIVFSFSHAEYRITIPFYPIVIAFSAIGLVSMYKNLKKKFL